MFSTLRNAWKLPELRKKLIFTMMMLLVYRIGNAIPVPYIDAAAMSAYFSATLSDTILGLYNAMSGSAFSQASVLALGIQPYINASIIIQLLTIAIPVLERWAKEEGEMGKKKIERLTRYTTVALGLLLGFAYYTMISSQKGIITDDGIMPAIVTMLVLRCGMLMQVGGDKILLLYNPSIYETADVISTHVQRMGIEKMQYGYSAAVGLFNSVVGTILLIVSNYFSRKLMDTSIM